ncbi:hypothetical protein [Streptomyces collinus]|uniref:hypothetical protein n=1 Tax=Streptomyces collinus TaxID=42684 RepID=UPI0033E99BF8
MRRHLSVVVVAGWGLLNGLFLAVLAVCGESALVYWLWGGTVLMLELLAVAVATAKHGTTAPV